MLTSFLNTQRTHGVGIWRYACTILPLGHRLEKWFKRKTEMATINVRDFLESNKTSGYQMMIVFLMLLTVIFDGMDITIMGFIIPVLKQEWGLANMEAARVLSAALAGLIIGALVTGPIADKIGRKKILVGSVFLFGLFTLLCATATNAETLMAYRFIAGAAMGGVMPQAATLVTEFSPPHHRGKFVTIVFSGFTIGAAAGGFVSAKLISLYGWHSVMILCGVLPLILSLALLILLPESITFMVVNRYPKEKIVKLLNKMQPGSVSMNDEFILPQPQVNESNPVKTVLNKYFLPGSLSLWTAYFLGLLLVYLLGSWMPTIIENAGFTLQEAAVVGAIFQLGGPLGCVVLGWFMDRKEPHKVLAVNFLIGAVIMVAVSQISADLALLCVAVFFIGFSFSGGNTGMNALSSMFFPTAVRATGNSWMHGIGRFGAVASTFVGAWMLDLGWNLQQVLFALCIPAVLIVAALTFKYLKYKNAAPEHTSEPVESAKVATPVH